MEGTTQREWMITPGIRTILSLERLAAGSYYLMVTAPGHELLVKKIIILK
jgi:hypothetical protein